MEAFENITDKIVLLLEKTRDSILLDLEKQFSTVRQSLVQLEKKTQGSPTDVSDAIKSTQELFASSEQVVKAVFAQVGVDISHCDETEDFLSLLGKPLSIMDTLASDLEALGKGKDVDVSAILETVFKTFQDLIQLVKDLTQVEFGKIEEELKNTLGDAYEKFDLKDFAMSLLEYVILTILRNGREVFSDEIKYVKLQANEIYKGLSGAADNLRKTVKDVIASVEGEASKAEKIVDSLFRESLEEMENVYNNLEAIAKDTGEDIKKGVLALKDSQEFKDALEAYRTVSGYLTKIYAVLDFFGVVGQKKIEIKLPEKFISALKDASKVVSSAIGDASDAISGCVKDFTEDVNGAVSYATGTVNAVTGEAHENIQKAVGKIENLTGESLQNLDVTADLVNIPAISIPDYSALISSVGDSLNKELSSKISGGINYLAGLSYPISITTFKWDKIEKMFTDPENYFKEQYPVNSIEDAEALATKIIDIVRLFNPDIPDFQSIRSLLESILRELGEQVLSAAKDIQKELWQQVKPLMTMIRKTLDLLQEMYESLKREAHNIIQEMKRRFISEVVNPVSKEAEEVSDEVRSFVKSLEKKINSIAVPDTIEKIYDEILAPAVIDAIVKSDAPDPEKLVSDVKNQATTLLSAWGSGVSTHLNNFFSEDQWKKRLDGTISALEATFADDVKAVKSFLSPSTLNDFSAIGGKFEDLKDDLDINQYIKVVSEAFNGVSVPDPQLYYQGFKQVVTAIIKDIENKAGGYKFEHVETLASDIATGIWDRVRNKIINPIIREIKKQVLRIIREVIRQVIDAIIDKLPSYVDLSALSEIADTVSSAAKKVKVYANEAKDRITDVKNLSEAIYNKDVNGIVNNNITATITTALDDAIDIDIDSDWVEAAKQIAKASVEFSISEMSYADVIKLVVALYKAIPEDTKHYIGDMLPSLPKNDTIDEFVDFVKGMDYKADLDKTFAVVTVLDVKSEDPKEKEKTKKGTEFTASALIQVVVFAGEVPAEKKKEEEGKKEGEETSGSSTGKETAKSETGSGSASKTNESGSKDSGSKDSGEKEEEEEKEAALYCMLILNGKVGLKFDIGKNHTMSLLVEGGVGGKVDAVPEDDKTIKKLQNGLGFYITKGWDFNGVASWDAVKANFIMDFKRKNDKDNKNVLKVFDTKYLSLQIGNYPQAFYLGYDSTYPAAALKELGLPEEQKKEEKSDSKQSEGKDQKDSSASGGKTGGKDSGKTDGKEGGDKKTGNGLQVGYFGAIQDALISLHLQDVAFIKEVIKDDVELGFNTYIWYDYHRGFDFGGDVSLHMVYDLNHKKLGPLTIETFSLDAGPVKGEKGKMALVVGTTFQVEMGSALVVAIEDLGIGFRLNYLDEKGKFGDLDLDASFSYPSGFGITIDASAVKGGGFISIDKETGEFYGVLSLDIIKKISVGGFLMCDPGTAKGHDFSLVVLLSAKFNPGIPLGMGFSLTGVGGTLGLNRSLSRDAISNGVRSGTLDQVFFVEDLEKHLAEMKANVLTYFPAKKGQFFFGLLGQISFEPVVKCDFGLLMQLPSPVEIIIVGALRVNAAEGIVKINVYFAGGINFDTGMWFDASIVDSQIVGISISGDMAFRLNWGGKKGFLLSIGGFHPAYKPEESLKVGKMNRLAMKLDYSILKLSFETYMAITSNTFQIGARFDLKVGWSKFGITGYAGFDALFQFDPFMFMFAVEAGVSVKCGSWNLLSIDLALDVQGPAPWKVAGKAKFKFLLIPIKVSFSKKWGKDAPELPSKLVAVIPLFDDQWDKAVNWAIDNTDATGRPLVSLIEQDKDAKDDSGNEMIIQPDGSVIFNQSAIPMVTKDERGNFILEKMDICNDGIPSDYQAIEISSVNGITVGDTNILSLEQNDFAPSLYKSMSIDEKLKSESYVKYDSGFKFNEKDIREIKGSGTDLERLTAFEMISLAEVAAENIGSASVRTGQSTSVAFADRKKSSVLTKTVGGIRKERIPTKLEPVHTLPGGVEPIKVNITHGRKPGRLEQVLEQKAKKLLLGNIVGALLDYSKSKQEFRPVPIKPKPGKPFTPKPIVSSPTPIKVNDKVLGTASNNRRDRLSFDRYIVALQKKQSKQF